MESQFYGPHQYYSCLGMFYCYVYDAATVFNVGYHFAKYNGDFIRDII